MYKYLIFLWSVLLLLLNLATPYNAKAEECKISNKEAIEALKNLIPNGKILEVRPSPIDALCELTVEAQGRKGIFYINSTKRLLFAGSIIDIQTLVDLTKERLTDINRVDISQIPLKDALILGKAEAKYKVIVFDDPD